MTTNIAGFDCVLGCDVSRWQGGINYNVFNLDFVIYGDDIGDTWDSFGVTGGKVNYRRFNGSVWQSFNSATSVNDGNWHMIAVTYNSSTLAVTIYVDGVSDATGTMAAHQAKGGIKYIGRGFDVADDFDGNLGQLVVYDVVISPTDMLAIWNAS